MLDPDSPTTATPATFADLVSQAQGHLAAATALLELPSPDRDLDRCLVGHRDLTAALAHLGRTLGLDPAGPAHDRAPRLVASDSDHWLVRTLGTLGQTREWTPSTPSDCAATARVSAAAMSVRATADLWATHRSPDGAPRSPEASRMRHPSMRGAAVGQWRELVTWAAALAGQLAELLRGQPAAADHRAHAAAIAYCVQFPTPRVNDTAAEIPKVQLTVARPATCATTDPLARVAATVQRIRLLSWNLAESGTAAAPLLTGAAALAQALHRAAGQAHSRAAECAHPSSWTRHERARSEHVQRVEQWADVARCLQPLRTSHPATTLVQVDRQTLPRILDRVAKPRPGEAPRVAAELSRLGALLDDVARFHLDAIGIAQTRAEVYVVGRALPTELLGRRPDLLEARLADRVVPAPTFFVRRLEAAYQAILAGGPDDLEDDASPAA